MKATLGNGNRAEVALEAEDIFHFSLDYLEHGEDVGFSIKPPAPAGSPIARLLHKKYWLHFIEAGNGSKDVSLKGPSAVGRFEQITIARGAVTFVRMDSLVGFSIGNGGGLSTLLSGIGRPLCWAFGHPLPVLFKGPATVIVYGEALRWDDELQESKRFAVRQVVAFDAHARFKLTAMLSNSRLWSQIYSALTLDSRISFHTPTPVLLEDVNRPQGRGLSFVFHFCLHFVLIGAALYVISRL